MTPQGVIKNFIGTLSNHGYADVNDFKANELDNAVASTSRFTGIQDVIDSMEADQIAAEKQAVEEILGSEYAGKTMAEIDPAILNANAKDYDTTKISNAYLNNSNDNRTTVRRVIEERTAYIFLEDYCGIQLPKKYWLKSNDTATSWSGNSGLTGNVDTGAITGSDANIMLKAGDVVYGTTLTADNMQTLAEQDGISLSGDTLIIGTGTEKTERTVVSETFVNAYTASGNSAQIINTGTRGWVVSATSADDTITSDGADSINAGAGNDDITVNADDATITSGAGNDKITISADVRNVTFSDLNSADELTIEGKFEIGAATIEDMVLIVTDTTGKRKLRFSDFETAQDTTLNIDGASTQIGNWLSNSGIDINTLEQTTYAERIGAGSSSARTNNYELDGEDDGRIAVDESYKPTPVTETPTPNRGIPSENANTDGTVTVNLDKYTTLTSAQEISGGSISSEYPNATTFTRNGLTIHLLGVSSSKYGDPEDSKGNSLITLKTFDELTPDQKTVIAGLFRWWAGDCLTLNEESYGIGFNSDTATEKDIGLYFFDSTGTFDTTLAAIWNWSSGDGTGEAVQIMLDVNMKYYTDLSDTDVDGTTEVGSAGFLDRTLAHEFTHGVMASNIRYFSKLPQFIKEGSAELTHGVDDERGESIFSIACSSERLASSVNISNTGTGTSDAYAGGYILLRYFARQASLQTLFAPAYGDITANVNISGDGTYYISGDNLTETASKSAQNIELGTASGNTYTAKEAGVKQIITTGAGNWNVKGLTSNMTLNSSDGNDTVEVIEGAFVNTGAGNDSVEVSARNATVQTGADSDTVYVYGSENIIDAGTGNDYIFQDSDSTGGNVYVINTDSGEDTIEGFKSNDLLFITGEYTTQVSGSNVIVTVGDAKVTLQNTASNFSEVVNILREDEENPLLFTLTEGKDEFDNTLDNATIEALGGNDTIFNYGANVSINGGANDDDISNSFVVMVDENFNPTAILGAAENSTVNAGKGDDVINNYGASATLIGGEGKDSIYSGGIFVLDEYGEFIGTSPVEAKISVEAGIGDDYIFNENFGATINAGVGNDKIENYGENVLFVYNAGDGSDIIEGFNENSTLQIGGGSGTYSTLNNGKDIIVTVGDGSITLAGAASLSNVNIAGKEAVPGNPLLITGTENADTIDNTLDNATIEALGGNDTIFNYGANVSINGGAGDDDISNNFVVMVDENFNPTAILGAAENSTVNAGEGDDVINNYGASATLIGGKGKDSIYNYGILITNEAFQPLGTSPVEAKVSVDAGIGDDYIFNENFGATINAGADNDVIENIAASATLIGGAGKDSIFNLGEVVYDEFGSTVSSPVQAAVSIDAGDGDDYIYNKNHDATINADVGNDKIENYGENVLFVYNAGAGSDIIEGFDETSTLKITGAEFNSVISGNDVVLTVGDDSITLAGAKDLSTLNIDGEYENLLLVKGTKDPDFLVNELDNATIEALGGNDTVYNDGANVSINGGLDNDSISNYGTNATIESGDGEDTVSNALMVQVEGEDLYIIGNGDNAFIDVGDNDDVVYNYGAQATINGGKGNDSLYNNGVIVYYADYGVSDMMEFPAEVSIDAGEGDDYVYNANPLATIDGGKDADEIWNYGASATLIGGEGNDTIINYGTADYDANGNYIGETVSVEVSISGGDGNDKILNMNALATINGGAGSDSIYTYSGDSVTIDGGAGDDYINNRFYIYNVSINGGEGNDTILADGSSVTIDGGAGNDYIYNGDGKEVSIDGGAGNDSIYNSSDNSSIVGGEGNDEIHNGHYDVIKGGANVLIDGGEGNDVIENSGYYDEDGNFHGGDNTTINGGAGDDTITNEDSNYVTISGSAGNDSIVNSGANVSISGGDGADVIYNYNGDSVTIDGGAGNDDIFNNGSNVSISGGAGNDDIYNDNSNVSISGGAGDDTVYNHGASAVIDGGAGDDSIYNDGSNVTIDGGEGNDSIVNYGLNVSINGGDGNDEIYNRSISIWTELFSSPDNATIDGGKGNDSISNEGGKEVSISGGDGNDYIYNRSMSVWTEDGEEIFTPDNATLEGGAGDDSIYNESGENVLINGGAGNDYIYNGDGKEVSIDGGAGDDKIYNDGDDVLFVYNSGDGDDTINGFNATSTLSISGAEFDSVISGNDVIIKVGDGSITLAGAKDLSTLNIDGEKVTDKWSITGTTATYGTFYKTLITLSGLKRGLTVNDDGTIDGIEIDGDKIKLSAEVLGTSKVTVTGNYTLELDDTVPTKPEEQYTQTISGTTAMIKQSTSAYYKVDGNKIVYTSAKKGTTIATITGLKKGCTADDINFDGETITLSANALGTSTVKLTKGNYALEIDDALTNTEPKNIWTVSGTTATYSLGTPAHYKLSANGKYVTYTKAIAGDPIIKLTGLKRGLTADSDGNIDGIRLNENVVTLSANVLDKKTVTVSEGYTLALDGGVTVVDTEFAWSNNGTTASLKQTTTKGYAFSNGDRTLTYKNKNVTTTLATVKGIKQNLSDDNLGKDTIYLTAEDLKSKVTIGGSYAFEFDDSYGNATITGSAKADTITANGDNLVVKTASGNDNIIVGGSNVSITAGAGNDEVSVSGANSTVNAGKGDDTLWGNADVDTTFIYASGDGKDVIYNFGDSDNLLLSGITFKESMASYNAGELSIKVGNGSITLQDFSATTFNVNGSTYEISGDKLTKK